ncbi:hypothetical protein Tco_1125514 [Tanacetum coccineum]|uniref:Uncharacterized protein n=1 Tax=Tanacetum coccineum TaxID=301880 RepID=A0ABQ5J963_9ASTR
MSDSDESGVTYTEVSSPFEDLSDIGSPRADDHEFLELPYMPEDPYLEAALQAPPSPDYVPGPEVPEHAHPSPDYFSLILRAESGGGCDEDPVEDSYQTIMSDEDGGGGALSSMLYNASVAFTTLLPVCAEETEHDYYSEPLPVPSMVLDSRFAVLLAISSPPASPLYPWPSNIYSPLPNPIHHHPRFLFPLTPPLPFTSVDSTTSSPIVYWATELATIRMRAGLQLLLYSYHYHHLSFTSPPLRPDAHHPAHISSYFNFHHCIDSGSQWDEIVENIQGAFQLVRLQAVGLCTRLELLHCTYNDISGRPRLGIVGGMLLRGLRDDRNDAMSMRSVILVMGEVICHYGTTLHCKMSEITEALCEEMKELRAGIVLDYSKQKKNYSEKLMLLLTLLRGGFDSTSGNMAPIRATRVNSGHNNSSFPTASHNLTVTNAQLQALDFDQRGFSALLAAVTQAQELRVDSQYLRRIEEVRGTRENAARERTTYHDLS